MFQRYAVIQGGQIVTTISWAGDAAPDGLPAGTTLMLESDAITQGVPRAVPAEKPVSLAQDAILANRTNIAQDMALVTAAQALTSGSGSLTNAQLTAAVRQLATAVIALARNDAQGNRQRSALILRDLASFDPTGANTQSATSSGAPGDAVADVPPGSFSTP